MYYNRSVTNISNTHITNVYNKTVVNNVTVNRVSYNGGKGGLQARPTAADQAAARDSHVAATPVQHQHEETARGNPQLRLAQNKGRPPITATARAGEHGAAPGAAESHPTSSTGEAPSTQPKHEPTTHEAPVANGEAPNREAPANHESAPHRIKQHCIKNSGTASGGAASGGAGAASRCGAAAARRTASAAISAAAKSAAGRGTQACSEAQGGCIKNIPFEQQQG